MTREVEVEQLPAQDVLAVRREVSMATIGTAMDSAFGALWRHVAQTGAQPAGPPLVLYLEPPEGEFTIEVCVPVAANAVGAEGIDVQHLPATEAATLVHQGPYDGLSASWQQLGDWVRGSGRTAGGPAREVYVTDPRGCAPEDLRTQLVIPLT